MKDLGREGTRRAEVHCGTGEPQLKGPVYDRITENGYNNFERAHSVLSRDDFKTQFLCLLEEGSRPALIGKSLKYFL